MISMGTRMLKALSVFLVAAMVLTSFSGISFADMNQGGGTAAAATSKSISDFDYSGNKSKTMIISDGAGHDTSVTFDRNLASIQGIVGVLSDGLKETDINAELASANTFKLTSRVIGKNSVICISGPNAADFFAPLSYRGTATDLESVADTKAGLTPFYDSDDSIGWVTGNMTLPSRDVINGTDISWSSDNTDVISNTGHVTRKANDIIVTLTAKGSEQPFERLPEQHNLILHSDKWWYTSKKNTSICSQKEELYKGNCLDNSVIENFCCILRLNPRI